MEKLKSIVAFVTQQRTCEKIISKGFSKARDKDHLYIVNIVNPNENFLYNNSDGEALEFLYKSSKDVGANLTVLRAENTIEAMVKFISENDITHVVLGSSPQSDDPETHPIVKKLRKHLKKTEYIVV